MRSGRSGKGEETKALPGGPPQISGGESTREFSAEAPFHLNSQILLSDKGTPDLGPAPHAGGPTAPTFTQAGVLGGRPWSWVGGWGQAHSSSETERAQHGPQTTCGQEQSSTQFLGCFFFFALVN